MSYQNIILCFAIGYVLLTAGFVYIFRMNRAADREYKSMKQFYEEQNKRIEERDKQHAKSLETVLKKPFLEKICKLHSN